MSGTGATGGTDATATGTVVGLQVNKASYGVAPSSLVDVTSETAALIKDGNLNFTVSPQAFGVLDPAPGVKKTFQGSFVINNGRPTILLKDDGEVFDLTAPTLKEKKETNHFDVIKNTSVIFGIYFLGVYFAYSTYRLGSEGITNGYGQIIGSFLALIIFSSFASLGGMYDKLGIFSLIFSIPGLIFPLMMLVFLLLCYNLDYINYSYLDFNK